MTNLDQGVRRMNDYGKANIPFLFVIDFEMREPLVLRLDEVKPDLLLYELDGLTNSPSISLFSKDFNFKKHPIPINEYAEKFETVLRHIRAGNTYLLNLTCPTPVTFNLSLEELFHASQAKYKLLLNNRFLCFSPETFVRIEQGGIISSYPMKGTIDASIENAQQVILEDFKEIAEHSTIVDLIRNDLNRVAKQVKVERFRYIEKIKTHEKELLQVSSKITGKLPENYASNIGNILVSMLPAGSVTGAPKKKTVEIILESEKYDRGYYTGVAGWFDGQNLDSAVMIRFIEKSRNGFVFKSGGGITSFSHMESEYREMIDKVYVPLIGND